MWDVVELWRARKAHFRELWLSLPSLVFSDEIRRQQFVAVLLDLHPKDLMVELDEEDCSALIHILVSCQWIPVA